MASHLQHFLVLVMVTLLTIPSRAQQLTPDFYNRVCPQALPIIKSAVQRAIFRERRVGASLLRLHFHDCFVNVSCIQSHAHAWSRDFSNQFMHALILSSYHIYWISAISHIEN